MRKVSVSTWVCALLTLSFTTQYQLSSFIHRIVVYLSSDLLSRVTLSHLLCNWMCNPDLRVRIALQTDQVT